MSSKRKLALLLALPLVGFALLLGFLWNGLGEDPTLLPSVLVDHPLPEFKAATLADPQRTVEPKDLRGNIALLNVWATWCPTCEAEHQMLRKLAGEGVIIYGLNYKDQRELALRWLTALGNPYRFVIDDSAGQIGIDLGVYGAPETFLLDGKGVIRYRHVGALDDEVWRQEFLPRIGLLKGKSG
ncbi:MAG: DsbE family thiol:disulfide interchange protein [Gammaproteobacteria bacterium]|nr:DsbE family thiol:disulfide interchange protein [Gammaproteobacteria bacterium]MCP5424826.1 DsbE family thiol:disulfide interchange protein [Gammaproteobacteria bacterium]MCP5458197.1 DsbE family thiol:disulfide interchange protein [Gammaproteobacteria bacterium]